MKTNKVLHIRQGETEVVEKTINAPAQGFVRVRQTLAPNWLEHRIYETGFYEFHEGECHSGHEGVGVIDAVGPDVTKWKVGQRVVIFQGWACGECHVCVNGLGATHCVNLKIPGEIEDHNHSESGGNGFCEYRLVPQNMLELIPDDLGITTWQQWPLVCRSHDLCLCLQCRSAKVRKLLPPILLAKTDKPRLNAAYINIG